MFCELIMIIFGCFTFSIISPNHTDPQHCIVSFAWLETDSTTCCWHAYRQWWNNLIDTFHHDFIIIYSKDSSTTAIMSEFIAERVLPHIERYSSRCNCWFISIEFIFRKVIWKVIFSFRLKFCACLMYWTYMTLLCRSQINIIL